MSNNDAEDWAELAKFSWLGTWFSLLGLYLYGRWLDVQATSCSLDVPGTPAAQSDCNHGSVPSGLFIIPAICGVLTVLLLVGALVARVSAMRAQSEQPRSVTTDATASDLAQAPVQAGQPPTGVRLVLVPDVGEGVSEVQLITWHASYGRAVEVDEPIAIVETEMSLVELPSPYAGVVTGLLAAEGQTLKIGAPLLAVDTGAAEPERGPSVASRTAPPPDGPSPSEDPVRVPPAATEPTPISTPMNAPGPTLPPMPTNQPGQQSTGQQIRLHATGLEIAGLVSGAVGALASVIQLFQ